MSDAQMVLEAGNLVINTPYDPGFVADLKAEVPYMNRKWDGPRKAWLVTPDFYKTMVALIGKYYAVNVILPDLETGKPETAAQEQRIVECRYIGTTKERGSGERTALGWTGTWSIIFPECVLKQWFGVDPRPGGETTLYARLGIHNNATPDEVKAAYRRLAKSWHPDVCHEPDAQQQFQTIQAAYEVLGDTKKRARYNAGLALERTLEPDPAEVTGYRCPIRCGNLIVTGTPVLDKFSVTKIDAWMDIQDAFGRVLIASWPMGATAPVEKWI